MTSHTQWLLATVVTLCTLVACATVPAGPPARWSVVDVAENSSAPEAMPGEARTTIFFSRIPWQSQDAHQPHYARGWLNDVLVGNPYSFQVRVSGGDLLADGLIVRDVATGAELPVMSARVNQSQNAGPPSPTSPNTPSGTMLRYPDPQQAGFVARPAVPTATGAYTIELVSTCRGRLRYTDLRCPQQDGGDPDGPQAPGEAALMLTISPALAPTAPQHGDKLQYDLISRNANGETSTRITAIHVAAGRCETQNLLANPHGGKVGDRIAVEWFVSDCRWAQVKTNDPAVPTLYFSKVAASDAVSAPNFNDSRPYVLPKRHWVGVTLTAADAMGRPAATKILNLPVDPCSISATDSQCPTRCQATPTPADCAQPQTPVCPVGEGDADRQNKQFNFEVLCSTGGGTAFKKPESEWACTEAAALTAVNNRQTLGCAVVQRTGDWVDPGGGMTPGPDCPGGPSKQDWQFCLGCSSQTGPVFVTETRNACFLPDAVEQAKANRPTQSCWMENQGACP